AGGLVAAAVLVLVIGILLSGGNEEKTSEGARSEPAIQVIPPPQSVPSPAQTPTESDGTAPVGPLRSEDGVVSQDAQSMAGPETSESVLSRPALTPQEAQRDGDKLFRDRRGASATWLAGAYRGLYTIQLLTLTSEQAQASITRMLMQDDYYKLHEQFYILRKKSLPPTFFVFYGIYDSMDTARETRNSMPVFLRKHHPYPLAISDALKKTEE
ncbi:MAG: hypothetical protein RBT36_10680, partial [Desulfobulbus sp.]|nr:hypothetical protein [Desulfobulbus sp.]